MKRRPPQRGRSIVVLLLLLLLWSLCLGWGLAMATEPRPIGDIAQASAQPGAATTPTTGTTATVGTVDVIPDRLKLGQEVYLQNCATCHIGIPPAVLPTETWRQLLQDSEHYGVDIKPITPPFLQAVWEYVRFTSRPQDAAEETPYRIYQSQYFKALHPRVKLPVRAGLTSCISCHPGGDKYDFRTLSSEWQNAP